MRETVESADFRKIFKSFFQASKINYVGPVQTHLLKRFQKVIDPWNELFLRFEFSRNETYFCKI
jgi:hypothetical protein